MSAACKPEVPSGTTAAGTPDEGPTPAAAPEAADAGAQEDPSQPGADPSATLAAGTPAVADPETPAEPAVADDTPPEPEEPAYVVPEEPYSVLMIGDSLVATGIGALLEKKLDAHPHVNCYRKGKSSSGLARYDFYDWPDQANAQIEFRKPDLVIVILGGNDGQDLTRAKNGRGSRVSWNDEEKWATAYRERMDSFLAKLSEDDRKVLWLGLPQMGMRSLEKKLTLIRGVQKEAVAALGDQGVYLDTVPFVTTEEGELLRKAKVGARGKLQEIRAEDGIHFTMAGSEYFADHVYPTVLETLALEDVQPDP